jgi:hypothetical membrane protein
MLRIALFLVAVWILTAWLVGRSSKIPRAMIWLAPVAVALTPGIADDLTRYGPADPMMVAGLIIGLALIGAGVRHLVFDPQTLRSQALAGATIISGYLIYLVGVYSKEASFCLLAFVPFFLKWLAGSGHRYMPGSRRAWSLVAALGILLVAPLLHVATHLALSLFAGDRPYPAADHSLPAKVYAAGVSPLLGHPPALHTWLWVVAAPGAIIVAVTAARRRERDAWLLVGVLTTGFLMTSLALGRGEIGSWYYIPWIVAVAAVGFRGLAQTNVGLNLGVAALVVLMAVSGTRTALANWAQAERSGSTAVEIASGLVNAGCPVYLANFDIEQRVAIPLLFPHANPRAARQCAPDSAEAYAVSWKSAPLPAQFAAHCDSRWQNLGTVDRIGTYRCGSFRPTVIADQNAASGYPDIHVVALRPSTDPPRPLTLFQSGARTARP